MEIGKIYHGFQLLLARPIREMKATAYEFIHEKSGARLLYMETDDDNKVFSITFRTPPQDDMGTAHIVEHSTLCGSRKFPLREPFVELVKGSLNTYLNAMTFSDKTMYPVASRNAKDFQNLLDVYLDAVFYPAMYERKETLMQEGWHYELEDPKGEIVYKGVVYNEMKGAFSSPEALLDKEIQSSLFPDTAYGFESGGDPDAIPQLTQEKFLAFHKKYYHPSNSYIYLYGDMDIEEKLAFLDSAYLSAFERAEIHSEIAEQSLFGGKRAFVKYYPVSPAERLKNKTFLSWNCIVGRAEEAETMLALQVLEHFLLRTQGAPLKKALIDAGVGKDVLSSFGDGILQPTFSIVVTGAEEEKMALFETTLRSTLEKLAKDGIDQTLIEASVNLLEFRLREANFGSSPKGLVYNIRILDSWLYGLPPELYVSYEKPLENIKAGYRHGYFERLIKERLLENRHVTTIVLKPQANLAEKRDREVREALAAYKKTLSKEEIAALVETTRKLHECQKAPDSPQALATIPLLNLSDIEPQAEKIVCEKRQYQGSDILYHELPTNKIAYLGLYFDLRYVPQEDISYAYLLSELLGKVSTSKRDYGELANLVNLHTGGISYDAIAYTDAVDADAYYPKFKIKAKALASKIPELFSILTEVLTKSVFTDRRRLRELIDEMRALWELHLQRSAQQVAAGRVVSYFSDGGVFNEEGLLSFYDFVVKLDREFDARIETVSEKLTELCSRIFNSHNLLTSIALEKEDYPLFEDAFGTFYTRLSSVSYPVQKYQFHPKKRNEGLMSSSKIQYVVKGANFRHLGFSYVGSLRVMETILRYEYLWSKIRVQGGAYGAFTQLRRNGNMVFGSYRDPNLAETIDVYDHTAQYLRSFQVDEREMTKYIIGTISALDTPLTPQMKGDAAAECYIRHISQVDLQKERDEVLATTAEDIRYLGDLIDACMKENYLCVFGGEEKLKKHRELFGELKSVFE